QINFCGSPKPDVGSNSLLFGPKEVGTDPFIMKTAYDKGEHEKSYAIRELLSFRNIKATWRNLRNFFRTT
ncbi:hypothetical protein LINPERHAP2_LOCUS34925, partial [Linum perenne]